MQGFFQRYLLLYRPLISKLNDILSRFDLSYSLWQIIFYVKTNGSTSLVEISNHFNVEKPTITRTVRRLEEKGIVQVVPSNDKREKIIELTETGKDIYKKCRDEITDLENRVMGQIPEIEQYAASHMLLKIRENIINDEGSNNEES
jgi:MarR family transcriptional regulator for hemolysin